MKKKTISLFLVFCMLMSMVPASALAAEAECNNHLEHDSTCGWREASEGCECRHKHDDSCGYAESGVCSHTEHDASCGYSAPVEAVKCAHSCELCTAVKNEEGSNALVLELETAYYPTLLSKAKTLLMHR